MRERRVANASKARDLGERPSPPPPPRETRGARRKRETRQRLLRGAYRLIAEKGVDAVTINEVTEAADVGFGSFYNYFPSKEAVYEAVFNAVFEEFGGGLDELTRDLEDPAEVVAVCVRHTIARARREPLWGRFLVREGYGRRAMTHGLAPRLLRDIRKGIAGKRFRVNDPQMALYMAGGTVMGTIAAELVPAEDAATHRRGAGPGSKDLAERAATMVLQGLGLAPDEAAEIARRPLSEFEAAPVFE